MTQGFVGRCKGLHFVLLVQGSHRRVFSWGRGQQQLPEDQVCYCRLLAEDLVPGLAWWTRRWTEVIGFKGGLERMFKSHLPISLLCALGSYIYSLSGFCFLSSEDNRCTSFGFRGKAK